MKCIEISRRIPLTVMVLSVCGWSTSLQSIAFTFSILTWSLGTGIKQPHAKTEKNKESEWEMRWVLQLLRTVLVINFLNGDSILTTLTMSDINWWKDTLTLMMWEPWLVLDWTELTDIGSIIVTLTIKEWSGGPDYSHLIIHWNNYINHQIF